MTSATLATASHCIAHCNSCPESCHKNAGICTTSVTPTSALNRMYSVNFMPQRLWTQNCFSRAPKPTFLQVTATATATKNSVTVRRGNKSWWASCTSVTMCASHIYPMPTIHTSCWEMLNTNCSKQHNNDQSRVDKRRRRQKHWLACQ